jgi:DNA polymerase-3 subunit delta'
VSEFESFPEQDEAKRLLRAALKEGPAHAYLFHGPAGVGKRRAALAFAAELIGEHQRVERRMHPDLYVVEPLGEMIRIDAIRDLRHDLHMRPFEADRRVYLILSAELLNEEAADALLKDLEEPPPYAVVVLVANELGPLPETIRSRCQLVPFRRLSERAVREEIAGRAPGLSTEETTALARGAVGRLDRAERLLDPEAVERRSQLLEVARAVYLDPDFEPSEAASTLLEGVDARGRTARTEAETEIEPLDLPARERDQHLRRAARGAEREELLTGLDELGAWYRDLIAVAVGAERAVIHVDRLADLTEDASRDRIGGAERACEAIRETWRSFEEFNINPSLALEAMFVRLRRELASSAVLA